ncbi:ArsR/SmtB family transcription factor [Caldovatus aquaticus]|uniref:Helix-turn-helix domain-containing protein n=1 Tax=Caldovatus aquaticus TaxID=2865671 RepID=A0ABS7F8F2_9PROT|nr:helix-turn-helix domain-containing protein [Caldovatus aquaticus]MBW8271090.1 helix-turn-helix domain-containing protein [Caldovatus aquaticus]
MPSLAGFTATAALLADPARSAMLHALLGGEALTAGELARIAGIAPPTASGHLAQLLAGGLVAVHRQGRHRYHRLASEEVAAALEALGCLAALADGAAPRRRAWPHGEAFRTARLCYDHLAGRLGVGLHARLTAGAWLVPAPGGWRLSGEGAQRLAALGLDLDAARRARRFACDCMDWSERRPHLAGGLGRALAQALLRQGWLRRAAPRADDPFARRRLAPTPEGARVLREAFGLDLAA